MIDGVKEVWTQNKRISLIVSADNKVIHNDPFFTVNVNPNWGSATSGSSLTIKTDVPNFINWGFTSGYWTGRIDLYGTTATKNFANGEDNNVNSGITQTVSVYNDVIELEMSTAGATNSSTPDFRINEVTKKIVLIGFTSIDLTKIAKNLALEYFEKVGDQNAISTLTPLNGLTKLKTLKITNAGALNLLSGFANSALHLFYIITRNLTPDITSLETACPNLKCLVTDTSPQDIDWISRTNIKGYRSITIGSPPQALVLDLKTILTGKLHFINLERVSSLTYSGGGIFPSVIHDNEGYFAEAIAIIKCPPSTVNTIANGNQVAQLLIDFANQVTAVNIPADKKKIITGRTPTSSYTDNSQPIYKTYSAAKTYIQSLGITISNA